LEAVADAAAQVSKKRKKVTRAPGLSAETWQVNAKPAAPQHPAGGKKTTPKKKGPTVAPTKKKTADKHYTKSRKDCEHTKAKDRHIQVTWKGGGPRRTAQGCTTQGCYLIFDYLTI